jgi:uncharacterized protein (TIGR03435 family)
VSQTDADARRSGTERCLGDDPLSSLFDALQEQLGLNLEDKKALFDVVVDLVENVLTEN